MEGSEWARGGRLGSRPLLGVAESNPRVHMVHEQPNELRHGFVGRGTLGTREDTVATDPARVNWQRAWWLLRKGPINAPTYLLYNDSRVRPVASGHGVRSSMVRSRARREPNGSPTAGGEDRR